MAWNPQKMLGLGGPSASPYRQNQAGAARRFGQAGDRYESAYGQANQAYGSFNPQFQGAVRGRVDYLQNDPFGGEQDRLALGQAAGESQGDFDRAQSSLTADLSRRNIGGGVEAGALSNLHARRAASNAATRTLIGLQRILKRDTNQREAVNLLGDTTQMYGQTRNQALGGYMGAAGGEFNAYGDMAQAEEARKAAGLQGLMQTLSGLGSVAGGQMGGNAYNKSRSRIEPYSDPWQGYGDEATLLMMQLARGY